VNCTVCRAIVQAGGEQQQGYQMHDWDLEAKQQQEDEEARRHHREVGRISAPSSHEFTASPGSSLEAGLITLPGCTSCGQSVGSCNCCPLSSMSGWCSIKCSRTGINYRTGLSWKVLQCMQVSLQNLTSRIIYLSSVYNCSVGDLGFSARYQG